MKTIRSTSRLRATFMRTFFALFAAALLVLASCAKEEEEPVKKTDTELKAELLQSLLDQHKFKRIFVYGNGQLEWYTEYTVNSTYLTFKGYDAPGYLPISSIKFWTIYKEEGDPTIRFNY